MTRCKHCGRTVWEQLPAGSGLWHHHHNWNRLCFPNQLAEVDEDNPEQEYPVEPEEKESDKKRDAVRSR